MICIMEVPEGEWGEREAGGVFGEVMTKTSNLMKGMNLYIYIYIYWYI